MKRLIAFIFMILGFFLFGFGIFTSFEIYAIKKQEKINANFANFVLSIYEGKELKRIDYPDQSFFIFRSSEGKVSVYGTNIQNPTDLNFYSSYQKRSPSATEVYIYTRKYNFGEYVEELLKNLEYIGIALAGLILFTLGAMYSLTYEVGQKEIKVKETQGSYPESLQKKLKALRLTLATHTIIPKESSEEAKRILDDIFKEMEGRK